MKYYYLKSVDLVLVKRKGSKYIETYTLEELKEKLPKVFSKILAELV